MSEHKTLGLYRDFCALFFGEDSASTKLFDAKIAKQGRDMPVLADASQMLILIASMVQNEQS